MASLEFGQPDPERDDDAGLIIQVSHCLIWLAVNSLALRWP
ncbi:MAG: hypothetical protein ACFB0G_25100 [Leptolyngbyaceae cyanobacterium]